MARKKKTSPEENVKVEEKVVDIEGVKIEVATAKEKVPKEKKTSFKIKLRSDLADAGVEFFDRESGIAISGKKVHNVSESYFIMKNTADTEEKAVKKDIPFYKG